MTRPTEKLKVCPPCPMQLRLFKGLRTHRPGRTAGCATRGQHLGGDGHPRSKTLCIALLNSALEAIAFVERGATGASLFRRLTGQARRTTSSHEPTNRRDFAKGAGSRSSRSRSFCLGAARRSCTRGCVCGCTRSSRALKRGD